MGGGEAEGTEAMTGTSVELESSESDGLGRSTRHLRFPACTTTWCGSCMHALISEEVGARCSVNGIPFVSARCCLTISLYESASIVIAHSLCARREASLYPRRPHRHGAATKTIQKSAIAAARGNELSGAARSSKYTDAMEAIPLPHRAANEPARRALPLV